MKDTVAVLKRFLRSSGKASGARSLAESKFLVTTALNIEKTKPLIRCGETVRFCTWLEPLVTPWEPPPPPHLLSSDGLQLALS